MILELKKNKIKQVVATHCAMEVETEDFLGLLVSQCSIICESLASVRLCLEEQGVGGT